MRDLLVLFKKMFVIYQKHLEEIADTRSTHKQCVCPCTECPWGWWVTASCCPSQCPL